MRTKLRWIVPAVVASIALGVVGFAFARGLSSAGGGGQPGGVARSAALRLWRGFAAGASPRPLILTGQGRIELPLGGFPSKTAKAAFLTGRDRLGAKLPAAPTRSEGYGVMSAAAAYWELRRPIPGHRARPHSRLTVSAVRLGHARFATDRGPRLLPAWLFSFVGVEHPAKVLAVRSSSVFTAPEPSETHSSESPYPDSNATIAGDDRTITVSFTGAHAGSEPCDASYSLAASSNRAAVALTVVEHPAPIRAQDACTLVGYERTATVRLPQPLRGRALISSDNAAVIPVLTQHPKQLTIAVPSTGGETTEHAELGSYCLPSRPGVQACADSVFDPAPPGHLAVSPRDLVTLRVGAPATSVSVRLAKADRDGRVVYLAAPLQASLGPRDLWAAQLPKRLQSARILEIFVRYAFGDAVFEAAISPPDAS